MELKILLILQTCVSFVTLNWCGFQPRWREDNGHEEPLHDRTLTYLGGEDDQARGSVNRSPGLNFTTGIFTAPVSRKYLVTLTAQIMGSDNKDLFTYAQTAVGEVSTDHL